MEIVIKIPDEAYQQIESDSFGLRQYNALDLVDWIKDGTPLPNVFDNIKSEILHYSDVHCSGDDINLWTVFGIMDKHISVKEQK